MTDRPFVHLHCHSHYSLLDGANRIPELIRRVKELGMNAVALTDHGNLYGAIQFYRACRAAGINPIIGYEAYVAPNHRFEREAKRRGEAGFHLTLLAKNATGFRNLIKLSSLAFTEGYHYVPRIDKELLERFHEGLICLSGCASAEFSELILKQQMKEAEDLAKWYHRLFGNDFYIEIQNNGLDIQKLCAAGAIDIAQKLGLPLVATSDAHYLRREDAAAHDVLLCINTRHRRADEKRLKLDTDQFYIRGPQEMYELFPGHEDAVKRSQEIANQVDIEIEFGKRHFPVFDPPQGKNAEEYLRELCEAGLKERYGDPPPQAAVARLEHELSIINRLGFASYFLIVWDFVRFAIERGIPASARGSACGAIVSYVLKLSHVDPLEYGLLFERFLDPNRKEAPDIDIDFCQDRREEVLQYVRDKYGTNSVAQIATFGTLAAKAAIKDVGRVLSIPLDRVNQLTAMVPNTPKITIQQAMEQNPELRREYETDPDVRELIDIALLLEGTNRNAGTHAAGVVIAAGDLTDYVPIQRVIARNGNGQREANGLMTQWVMGDLEAVGMLKMDFLGLRTLTLLDNCVKLIERTRGEKIDLYSLPLDDAKTYELLQRGDAKGVFQLESEGIRELLKRMRPDNIRDIIALMALYRPGPLGGGMVDAYINCKHGVETPKYVHPVMEEILAETYGVMVYQEDIMRILNRLGGIELSDAYQCIKAISKKKHEIIQQRREEFIAGAVERGVERGTAEEIFSLIEKFGSYGFNKSHSAAYAHVGYQTAYLKANYTPEFMAALLTSEIEDGNKRDIMAEHLEDAKRLGCPVQPPNINNDLAEFTVRDGKILFGLVAIKGLGRSAAEEIVRARDEGGPFQDFFDFCERIDHRKVPRTAIEKLIKAGAFDCLGAKRAQLWEVLPRAIESAMARQEDRRAGQLNLFDAGAGEAPSASPADALLPNVPEWPDAEKLKYEKEVLDFYLSSHPLAQYEAELARYGTHRICDLQELDLGREVLIGGMLADIRYRAVKRGNGSMLRCRLEDLTGSVPCLMWPDDLARYKDRITDDEIRFVAGVVERDPRQGDKPSLVITKVLTIDETRRLRTDAVWIQLSIDRHHRDHVRAIKETLKKSPGRTPVFICVTDQAGRHCRLKVAADYFVDPNRFEPAELETVIGAGRVRFTQVGNGHNGG